MKIKNFTEYLLINETSLDKYAEKELNDILSKAYRNKELVFKRDPLWFKRENETNFEYVDDMVIFYKVQNGADKKVYVTYNLGFENSKKKVA